MATLPTIGSNNALALLYRNYLVGRKGTTVTADSEDAGGEMGASNLLTGFKADAWRSGSVATRSVAGTPEIIIDHALSTARDFDFVALEWTNLQLDWRADLYLGDPAAAGVLQGTTGWMEPIVVSEAGDFPVGAAPSRLGPDAERIAELAADFRLRTFATLDPVVTGVDYVRWRIDCTPGANGSVDYVQASLMYGGVLFRPAVNFSLGSTIAPVFRSPSRRSAGDAKNGIRRRIGREVDLELGALPDDQANELATEWLEREGEFARVFVWREPEDAARRFFYDQQGAFTGTPESFDGVAIDFRGGWANGVQIAKAVKGIKIRETT